MTIQFFAINLAVKSIESAMASLCMSYHLRASVSSVEI